MRRRALVLSAFALALGACINSVDPAQPTPTDPLTTTYAPALGVDIATMTRTDSGLYYRDVVVGTGAVARATDSVVVAYAGYLPTGTQFTGGAAVEPLRLRLPARLIAGVRQGIRGMAVGGRRKLVISPLLGYGFETLTDENGRTILPANTVLVFDLELLGRFD
jgi:FKBP-type peptidyl-prolyl cis-trans isomerase